MLLFAAVDWRHYLFMIPLALLSVFLVLVILVQRGRGGGLTGALGGMGGQSAFGTKAGDLFTRITIVVAAIWVVLSMASLKVLNQYSMTANLNANERGSATTKATKSEGGVLPSATKLGESPAEKSAEKAADEQPADAKANSPAEAPAAAPPANDSTAKPADAAPSDTAKP
jgi:preprotein translocase subunit SecG